MLTAVTQPVYNPAEMPGQYGGQPSVPGGGVGMYQQPGQMSPYQPPQAQVTPTPQPPAQPEPPVVKAPLPPEHEVLQTTLDRLRDACAAAAPTPQIRRRLDDVSRKLEVLYDLLRGGAVADATISGLHQMVQYIQYGDFGSAQQIVQAVVQQSNFAQVSGFMPGVKSLVQIAQQLQVRI